MKKFNPIISLLGRVMMALIFVLSGLSKLSEIDGTQGYMEAMGVPGILVYPTIFLEIGAGIAIMVGVMTRLVALLLAGFSLLAAFVFHSQFSDQMQFIMFMNNVAIAGGLLLLVRNGAGELSLDNRQSVSAVRAST